MKVGVACGGTGGHIFPGLAVADVLRKKGHEVVLWLGSRDVEDMSTRGKWDGETVSVRSRGFSSGRISLGNFSVVLGLFLATLKCLSIMRKKRPDVLLAMGSYSSVGPVLAAKCLRIPVVLHESNAVPGRAILFLSHFADVIAVAFESAASYFRGARTVLTGFPLRSDLNGRFERGLLKEGCFNLLVMGGSQGAHKLNELAVSAVCILAAEGACIQVIHLTGRNDESAVRTAYMEANVPAVVFGFLDDMGKAYSAADFAVARSGSASCTELMVASVPTLFVPFPYAVRNHQVENARCIAASGAADFIEEKDLTSLRLADYIRNVMNSPSRLLEMKMNAAKAARPHASERLAELVEESLSG